MFGSLSIYVLLSCLHILNFLCQNVCSAVKLLSGLDDQILQNPKISANSDFLTEAQNVVFCLMF